MQILSKVLAANTALIRPITPRLSIYENFSLRDDIGSYIRTVYHMVSHTPKRGVGGSNPLWDARKHRCKPFFGVCSVFFSSFSR